MKKRSAHQRRKAGTELNLIVENRRESTIILISTWLLSISHQSARLVLFELFLFWSLREITPMLHMRSLVPLLLIPHCWLLTPQMHFHVWWINLNVILKNKSIKEKYVHTVNSVYICKVRFLCSLNKFPPWHCYILSSCIEYNFSFSTVTMVARLYLSTIWTKAVLMYLVSPPLSVTVGVRALSSNLKYHHLNSKINTQTNVGAAVF